MYCCPGQGPGAGVWGQGVRGREGWRGEVWVGRRCEGSGSGHLRLGCSPLQAQHLLSLVLIMIHLSAVHQTLVPGLWKGWKS